MINKKRILAIIPARGGSKRLPRKNVLPLAGKPLIGWSIDAAKDSKYIDQIFVSTDDQEIVDVVSLFDIDVPELRPKNLASDTATTESVLKYTLEKFGNDADIVVILQPTSPLRTAQHIDEALELFMQRRAFSIISVTPCEHPPQWANVLPGNDSMKDFIRLGNGKRSQDLSDFFRLNGAIYIYDIRRMLDTGSMAYQDDTYAYKMPNEFSIDIDNAIDFDMAEFFCEKYF